MYIGGTMSQATLCFEIRLKDKKITSNGLKI